MHARREQAGVLRAATAASTAGPRAAGWAPSPLHGDAGPISGTDSCHAGPSASHPPRSHGTGTARDERANQRLWKRKKNKLKCLQPLLPKPKPHQREREEGEEAGGGELEEGGSSAADRDLPRAHQHPRAAGIRGG